MRYKSFEKLPRVVREDLRQRLVDGLCKEGPLDRLTGDETREELLAAREEHFANPTYSIEELYAIVDAFITVQTAVKSGLPDNLYRMLSLALDAELAENTHRNHAIWLAHDGADSAKKRIRRFAEDVVEEIVIRDEADWEGEHYHRDYFLNRGVVV
ncbi:hypothetical protein HOD38_03405 [archaeon]|jgi:hypothetical protein|nr:hypothetical protein [archaeon]MBT4397287.1 hypothetical protein [archaeon]MBT4440667.1 hypothetical protein [archaeon]